ncbi:MAG: 30S ribosomal protein S2 [Candidatus Jorgensenbacteria bacterium GW2011_GWA1_48_11]|uniref:Small ribosomal subunit protein uS2 n=1 Tax=Candidatus Jorgensenbacteria bacterium GW2011_GWA1_48_11 TaxID=1618660 RepID=A0A0G1WKE3_9BACT|nr:MAG: 30S ribosomal protein S2 [Candidatus Jorgensenbacteria bacterium GW2011_GWA1_48_11]
MVKAGVIYGHKKSKTHPRMRPFIAGNRNEIELLDPEAIFGGLAKAILFLKEKVKAGGSVLLVGTNPAAKSSVLSFAQGFKLPYVVTRWLGGTLTNFAVLNKRKQYYNDLKVKKESGALAKYTKKEQLEFSNEITKLAKFFDGLENLARLPDAIFIVDIKEHETAFREAKKTNVPVVAILDTDDDTDDVAYPIFANDHSKSSIEWVMEKIKEGIKNGE